VRVRPALSGIITIDFAMASWARTNGIGMRVCLDKPKSIRIDSFECFARAFEYSIDNLRNFILSAPFELT